MSMGPFLMVGPVAGAKSATCVNPALVNRKALNVVCVCYFGGQGG